MNEMLIVYIYGIYPSGGISMLAFLFALSLGSYFYISWVIDDEENMKKAKKIGRFLMPIVIFIWTVGYFIPSKNIFLTMIATPHIIESLEDKTRKLNKLDRLLDKALNEALSQADDSTTTKELE